MVSWQLPPPLLNSLLGQTVQYTTYDGMSVVEITPAHPTGEYVVAIHGGAFILPPSIFHWLNYSVTAYQTGATVQVPIYPLVQEGGTAGTVVPAMAGLISTQIAQHGVSNVSVVGDSAGGNLALAAAQYMVSQGNPVPSSMVLLSPWLDVGTWQISQAWAGNLAVNDPLVSPLYGSLNGLPPTYVYSGSLDPLAQQAVVLEHTAVVQGAPFSFVLAPGKSTTGYCSPPGVCCPGRRLTSNSVSPPDPVPPGRPRTWFSVGVGLAFGEPRPMRAGESLVLARHPVQLPNRLNFAVPIRPAVGV